MDIEAAGLDPLYAQWKVWLETCATIATAFLPPEANAAEALGYPERATRQRLTEAGVQEMVHWAALGKPDHEVLLALAAYEKAKPYKVDLVGEVGQGTKTPTRAATRPAAKCARGGPGTKGNCRPGSPARKALNAQDPLMLRGVAQGRQRQGDACRDGERLGGGTAGIWRHMGRHRWRDRKMRRKRERYYARRYGLPCT